MLLNVEKDLLFVGILCVSNLIAEKHINLKQFAVEDSTDRGG